MRHFGPALLLVLAALGCPRAPREIPPDELAKGQYLAKPFTPPGRCFGQPSKCVSDGQCAPPFALCQEGTCCSGVLDPATCECSCGGGPACGPRELCCEPAAGAVLRAGETPGPRCRPVRECFGEG